MARHKKMQSRVEEENLSGSMGQLPGHTAGCRNESVHDSLLGYVSRYAIIKLELFTIWFVKPHYVFQQLDVDSNLLGPNSTELYCRILICWVTFEA